MNPPKLDHGGGLGLAPAALESGCALCANRPRHTFCNLQGEALEDFAGLGFVHNVGSRVILFREGTECNFVLLVCSGQVKLSCTSKGARTLILRIAMHGDLLGLGSAMSGSQYLLTAETLEPCTIKSIRRADFMNYLEQHGEASLKAARYLSHEYKTAFFDARRLALSASAASRLATVLLDWGKGAAAGKDMKFTMALTHEELANMVGTSRETVSRTLSRFGKEKLIRVNGSSIAILAPEKLEAIAV